MNPEQITSEIRRLAAANGERPVGERTFMTATGLQRSQLWTAGYANYGDALVAAGYTKNKLNAASDKDVVLASLANLIRRLGRFPTKGHIKAARAVDGSVPSYEALLTVAGGAFANLPGVARSYCKRAGADDVLALIPEGKEAPSTPLQKRASAVRGYVYLMKHGDQYKIGRSNDVARRRREVSLLMPEELEHVHIIETDDPEGIEAYWHRRFSESRLRGEWFALSSEQIAAFRRRRYQ